MFRHHRDLHASHRLFLLLVPVGYSSQPSYGPVSELLHHHFDDRLTEGPWRTHATTLMSCAGKLMMTERRRIGPCVCILSGFGISARISRDVSLLGMVSH